ncbi:hypothetical protein CV016_04410 [Yersinia kristensenii]|uniref:hypothetical protein n=1 Tax=Yersinia kristensenii TaxID=28152 RepID=UPI000C228176|nr:hypothetical protein [Yersinia kristensenii]PJG63867.1 hypothetical protein CV016_04410 [Yersinia kristensenii]
MSKQQTTQDMNALRAAVTDIDCLSQQTLLEIVAMAELLLHWMESPRCYERMGMMADTLNLISYRAQETVENIGREAESVGCEYIDHDRERRHAAAHQYKTGRGEHV